MYSVSMSLFDYIPVLCYGAAVFILQRDLYNKMAKGTYALFCAGTINVFVAGFLKATYKLLYALDICNFEALNVMFFPFQSLGFIMAATAIVCMLNLNQGKLYSLVGPAVFKGTMIFVSMMVCGVAAFNGSLAVISKKMKKNGCIVIFIVSAFASLMMGYLSSKDFTNPMFNWIGEGVNTFGQALLLIGVIILDKAGLEQFSLKKK